MSFINGFCILDAEQDAICSIGGLPALFLLLEQAVDRRINNVDFLTLDIDSLSASLSDDITQLLASIDSKFVCTTFQISFVVCMKLTVMLCTVYDINISCTVSVSVFVLLCV